MAKLSWWGTSVLSFFPTKRVPGDSLRTCFARICKNLQDHLESQPSAMALRAEEHLSRKGEHLEMWGPFPSILGQADLGKA